MARIEWDPVVPDYGKSVDHINSAVDDILARRERERIQRRLEARQQSQDDYMRGLNKTAEDRAKRTEERDFDKNAREQARQDAREAAELGELYDRGDDTLLEARINAGRWTDSKGNVHGQRFERGGNEPVPETPRLKLDESALQGHPAAARFGIQPKEVPAWQKAFTQLHPGMMKPPTPQEQGPSPEEARADELTIGQLVSGAKARVGNMDRLISETGQTTYLDRGERDRRAADKRNQAADDWLNNMAGKIGGAAEEVEAANQTAEAIRSHVPVGQAAQYYFNTLSQLRGQQFKGEQGDKDRANRLEQESIRNLRPRAALTTTPHQKTTESRALANSAHNLLNQELSREDYRDLITDARDTSKLVSMLESDNPAAHKMALGIWAKQASGPGAVQQSEREEFVRTVGGKDQSLRQMASNWLSSGEAPEAQRRIFLDAARNIIQRRQRETLGALQESVRDTYATHPDPGYRSYADWAASRVAPTVLGVQPRKQADPDEDRMRRAGF